MFIHFEELTSKVVQRKTKQPVLSPLRMWIQGQAKLWILKNKPKLETQAFKGH